MNNDIVQIYEDLFIMAEQIKKKSIQCDSVPLLKISLSIFELATEIKTGEGKERVIDYTNRDFGLKPSTVLQGTVNEKLTLDDYLLYISKRNWGPIS